MDTFATFVTWFGPFNRPKNVNSCQASQHFGPQLEHPIRRRPFPVPCADEPAVARQQRQTPGLAHSLFGSPFRT
jgi:hypothetical protein